MATLGNPMLGMPQFQNMPTWMKLLGSSKFNIQTPKFGMQMGGGQSAENMMLHQLMQQLLGGQDQTSSGAAPPTSATTETVPGGYKIQAVPSQHIGAPTPMAGPGFRLPTY
jgi:hypothetical protein